MSLPWSLLRAAPAPDGVLNVQKRMTWGHPQNPNFFISVPRGSFFFFSESSCGKTASEHKKMCYLNMNNGDICDAKIFDF